ncbi:MAG: imidazolonepropionase [Gammaproteobacteria bacterium]|nr:imidazolonepropionase [Gammaproteobacteria bacterium]
MNARKPWDSLWLDVQVLSLAGDSGYGRIDKAALACSDGRIAWVGPQAELPGKPEDLATTVHDGQGRWLTPGLIDCHTHLVYGGNRAREFELRLEGASYEDIARAGGGIVSTVRATREASEEELFTAAARRLAELRAEGVTTVEIKSGYGLDTESECKLLRVARRLGKGFPVTVRTSFLGAHALPPEYAGRADDYIDLVCGEMLPAVAAQGLADAVDAFCERIGFSSAQTRRVFEAAQAHDLPVKLHAEQLSDQGGAALVAEFHGLSADHLEYLSAEGIAAMAEAGTVAVLLPAAYYFLRETKLPPIAELRAAGVPMAIATDHNPGTAPVQSLLLMLNMACTLFRMTPEEALRGVTVNAAKALGLADRGRIAAGLRADFVLWDIAEPAELAYRFGTNPCAQVVVGGELALNKTVRPE